MNHGARLDGSAHCLTVDVEEHFQVSAFDSPSRRQSCAVVESRVERNTARVLELLAERGTRATFFVLGWIAERHPELVRAIVREGHELASHGYAHEVVTAQTPETFRNDVRTAKRVLEDIAGEPVLGYRAPSFTITARTLWALPILREEGYLYDSSIVPIRHDRYGLPGADPAPHPLSTPAGVLWEIPPTTVELGRVRLPVGGGGYLRLYPFAMFRWLLRRAARTGHPLVVYFHPWELDPEQPRMAGNLLSTFRQYTNLSKTAGRVRRLLEDFAFGPVREVVEPIRHLRESA